MFSMFRNTALAIVAGLGLLAAASLPAKATLITYTFSSDASYSFFVPPGAPVSDVIHFSGDFTIDTTAAPTAPLQSVSVTATCTGPDCPVPLNPTGPNQFNTGSITVLNGINLSGPHDHAHLVFQSSLYVSGPLPQTIPLFSGLDFLQVHASVNSGGPYVASGDVIASTPAPEPSSLALLAGVLGVFLLTRRAHRPDRAA
jgi:hypothetical protein